MLYSRVNDNIELKYYLTNINGNIMYLVDRLKSRQKNAVDVPFPGRLFRRATKFPVVPVDLVDPVDRRPEYIHHHCLQPEVRVDLAFRLARQCLDRPYHP